MSDDPPPPNQSMDELVRHLQRKVDVVEFDAASQRRAIFRLENQMDTVNWQLKLVDWIWPILLGAVLTLTWFVLTK